MLQDTDKNHLRQLYTLKYSQKYVNFFQFSKYLLTSINLQIYGSTIPLYGV